VILGWPLEPCEVSYKDKAGKYQAQQGITLPRL
jgi:deoxycytidine triphosphate deaminase